MNFTDICNMQISDDEKRGFSVKFSSDAERCVKLNKELIGLFGEVGEFANIAKKIGLKLDHPAYVAPTLGEAHNQLVQELGDMLIYIIRLAAVLDISLEETLINAIASNKKRYEYLDQ